MRLRRCPKNQHASQPYILKTNETELAKVELSYQLSQSQSYHQQRLCPQDLRLVSGQINREYRRTSATMF